ncbi:tRNA lysidine(34) synthetase TilS [Candidatus Dependentiae bacterium]|nr:tRNA lysidine(34) synthetase TilS [Candidatus Dependentiae bacterium]
MIAKIQNSLQKLIDGTKKTHIIVGLSGGPDSVFLLYILHSLNDHITLTAAHLNHGWRTQASDDVMFCKKLCNSLKIPFVTTHANKLDLSVKPNGSKEAMGRALRRHFFAQVKKEQNADYIALAHHQQDQQETFFLRLIRGCSLEGLTGMSQINDCYIRPLLATSKTQILDYLHKNNITYITDRTNQSDVFLRNRIRNHVIPALQKVDPRFDQKFETTLETLTQENRLLQSMTQQAIQAIFESGVGDTKKFLALHPILQKRTIIEWLCNEHVQFNPSTAYLEEITRFLASNRGGTHQINLTWAISKKQNRFRIKRIC